MAANLMDMFHNTVGEMIIRQASGMLGESADSTTSAVRSVVASLLGVLSKKVQTDNGAREVLAYLSTNKLDGSHLMNATNLLSGGQETNEIMVKGGEILNFLLGDQLTKVADSISGSSGLKSSSSVALLKLTAPFLMSVVGKYFYEKSFDIPGLRNLLQGQREYVEPNLPMGMEDILGLGTLTSAQKSESTASSTSSTTGENQTSLVKLLPWLVLLLTSLGLFYFVQRGCNSGSDQPADPEKITQDTLK